MAEVVGWLDVDSIVGRVEGPAGVVDHAVVKYLIINAQRALSRGLSGSSKRSGGPGESH
jgi:hypothetical protein